MLLEKMNNERFMEIVCLIEKQARHCLVREANLGSATRLIDKGRIRDDELRERFERLVSYSELLKQNYGSFNKDYPLVVDVHEITRRLVEIETSLSYDLFSRLTEKDIKVRLYRLWKAFDAIQQESVRAQQAAERQAMCSMQPETPFETSALLSLTVTELQILAEIEPDERAEVCDCKLPDTETLILISRLMGLFGLAEHCVPEGRMILAGRFGATRRRGRPDKYRGGRLGAHLLGFAEGLGLKQSRDHKSNPYSGVDAVIMALKRCADVDDPVSRTVLEEVPKTFHAFARRLLPKCKDGAIFFDQLCTGRILGQREHTQKYRTTA